MRYYLLCFVLMFSLQLLKAQSFNTLLASKLQAQLDSSVTAFTNTKGMSAAVFVPGQGVWTGVSGISFTGQPITSDMKFGIASNTKLFTATLIMILVEDNIIKLSDSISKWLPSYANVNGNITIKQLLSHTSGLSDPFFTSSILDSIQAHPTHYYTENEVLALVGTPISAPGGGYYYSNLNFILAGMLAQSATGRPIAQLIHDSILVPLQLDSTFYDIEEPEIGTLAHRWNDSVDIHSTSRISLNTAGRAAGSIFATAGEMVQWYQAFMNGGIINNTSFNEMTTFLSPGNYGLGIAKFTFYGKTTWGHGGSTIGYKSRMIYDPCMKVSICGLSNSTPSAVDGITAQLYKVLIDYLPACAGAISGSSSVCKGQNAVTYTVPAISNATSYVWTLPGGASGTSSSNSITVNFSATAVSGNISVKGINNYGEGSKATRFVSVNALPNVITTASATTICAGSSIAISASGATSYVWQPGSLSGPSITVSPLSTTVYTVTGSNANGCTKTATKTITVNACASYLNLKLFIQGYYMGGGLMVPVLQQQGIPNATASMTDSILVELRNTSSPYNVVAWYKTMLNTNGSASCNFPISGTYYITIKHRNALQTWSANPISLSSTPITYDFSLAANKAYGNNQVNLGGGIYGLYCGDLIADENIDLLDFSKQETDIDGFSTGYQSSDTNGDGNVDLLDASIIEDNINQFIYAVHP